MKTLPTCVGKCDWCWLALLYWVEPTRYPTATVMLWWPHATRSTVTKPSLYSYDDRSLMLTKLQPPHTYDARLFMRTVKYERRRPLIKTVGCDRLWRPSHDNHFGRLQDPTDYDNQVTTTTCLGQLFMNNLRFDWLWWPSQYNHFWRLQYLTDYDDQVTTTTCLGRLLMKTLRFDW